MNNTITASIPFSFKGENHSPSLIIDLDGFIKSNAEINILTRLIATENKIDCYSYEYEVLESSPIVFSQATGIAKSFLDNGVFDFINYKYESHCADLIVEQEKIDTIISDIAAKTLQLNALQSDTPVHSALQQAFIAGQKHQQG